MTVEQVELIDKQEPEVKIVAAKVVAETHVSPTRSIDKFAAARYAKKKQRRMAHRVTLRRSHTNG